MKLISLTDWQVNFLTITKLRFGFVSALEGWTMVLAWPHFDERICLSGSHRRARVSVRHPVRALSQLKRPAATTLSARSPPVQMCTLGSPPFDKTPFGEWQMKNIRSCPDARNLAM